MSPPRFDLRRLRALTTKEFAQISRDPSTFIIAFLLPVMLLLLFGYAVSLDATRIRVALVMQDDSSEANGLAIAFAQSPYFEVTPARALKPVADAMVAGEARGIVVIPPDFGRRVKAGEMPPVQVITDGSEPNTAQFVGAYAEGVVMSWMANRAGSASRPPVSINQRVWFNPALESRHFLVPGAIAIVMTMVGSLLTALVVAREWERGTMEAMLATPVSMGEFIASKVVPYFVLGLGSLIGCTLLATLLFGVPLRGSVPALLLIGSAFLLPSLGLGLWISAATKNQFVASQAAMFAAFLPTFLLSGFLYEISAMPWPIRMITYLVPARYLIPPLQTVFMAGDIWSLILPNVAVLLAFGSGFFLLSIRATRRSLD